MCAQAAAAPQGVCKSGRAVGFFACSCCRTHSETADKKTVHRAERSAGARRDAQVFAGAGWTVVRAQAAVDEGVGKIREGVGFFARGCRLLGSDLSSAGRLFYRAGAGASLKPREVQTCFLSLYLTLQQCIGTPSLCKHVMNESCLFTIICYAGTSRELCKV